MKKLFWEIFPENKEEREKCFDWCIHYSKMILPCRDAIKYMCNYYVVFNGIIDLFTCNSIISINKD